MEDGRSPVRYGGHFDDRFVGDGRQVSAKLVERALGLPVVGQHPSLEDDLARGRNFQVHGPALDDLDRFSPKPPGHGQLVETVRHLGGGGQQDDRVDAQRHGYFEGCPFLSAFMNWWYAS